MHNFCELLMVGDESRAKRKEQKGCGTDGRGGYGSDQKILFYPASSDLP